MPDRNEWRQISEQLRAYFPPDEVLFRVQSSPRVIAYIDSRTVAKRLDEVVGAENWNFELIPLQYNTTGDLVLAKGRLTIHGAFKESVGDQSNVARSKGTDSDALKRAAVRWGIGEYLYHLGITNARIENNAIPAQEMERLRTLLPVPGDPPGMRLKSASQPTTRSTAQPTRPTPQPDTHAAPTATPQPASSQAASQAAPAQPIKPLTTANTPDAVAARLAQASPATSPAPKPPAKPTDLGLQPATDEQKSAIKKLANAVAEGDQGPLIRTIISTHYQHVTAKNGWLAFVASLNRDDAKRWLDNFETWKSAYEQGKTSAQAPTPAAPPTVAAEPSTPPTPVHEMVEPPTVPEVDAPPDFVLPMELRARPGDPESPSHNGLTHTMQTIQDAIGAIEQFGVVEGEFVNTDDGALELVDGHLVRDEQGAIRRYDHQQASKYIQTLLRDQVRAADPKRGERVPSCYTYGEVRKAILLLEALTAAILEHSDEFQAVADTQKESSILQIA